MKHHEPVKQFEFNAIEHLQRLLSEIPFLTVAGQSRELPGPSRPDYGIEVVAHDRKYLLLCEAKSRGFPRQVRDAAAQLTFYARQVGHDAYGVLLAPYLSPEARQICKDYGIGFCDLEGNCRLVFNGVFVERTVAGKAPAQKQELRSLFAPKSAQIIRALMKEPGRAWKVAELSDATGASFGQVSKVRTALINREWATSTDDGLLITNAKSLLDTWRDAYRPVGVRQTYYTSLHGKMLETRIREALDVANEHGAAALSSFSAAQWLAPYGRVPTQYFYADSMALRVLREMFDLSSISKGENFVVRNLDDRDFYNDVVTPVEGIRCTSPVQTYLDLYVAGERGREAAEHLRREVLPWAQ